MRLALLVLPLLLACSRRTAPPPELEVTAHLELSAAGGERLAELGECSTPSEHLVVGSRQYRRDAAGRWAPLTLDGVSGVLRGVTCAGPDGRFVAVGANGQWVHLGRDGGRVTRIEAHRYHELADVVRWHGSTWATAAGAEVLELVEGDGGVELITHQPASFAGARAGAITVAGDGLLVVELKKAAPRTPDQLALYDGGSWVVHPAPAAGYLSALLARSPQDIWMAGRSYEKLFGDHPLAFRFNGAGFERLSLPLEAPVVFLFEAGGKTWAGSTTGELLVQRPEGWRRVVTDLRLDGNLVGMASLGSSEALLATDRAVYRLAGF